MKLFFHLTHSQTQRSGRGRPIWDQMLLSVRQDKGPCLRLLGLKQLSSVKGERTYTNLLSHFHAKGSDLKAPSKSVNEKGKTRNAIKTIIAGPEVNPEDN